MRSEGVEEVVEKLGLGMSKTDLQLSLGFRV